MFEKTGYSHAKKEKKKKKLDVYLIPHTKLKSKCIKDLNVRAKTKTQKKTTINLNGIGLGNSFSDVTPKTQTPKGDWGNR